MSRNDVKSSGEPVRMFTLATKLVEAPVEGVSDAIKGDAGNVGVTMAVALKRIHEEAENAKVEFAKITKAQTEMKENDIKKVDKLLEEHIVKIFA